MGPMAQHGTDVSVRALTATRFLGISGAVGSGLLGVSDSAGRNLFLDRLQRIVLDITLMSSISRDRSRRPMLTWKSTCLPLNGALQTR